jgi:hypothetical protein
MALSAPVDNSPRHPQANLPGAGNSAWSPPALVPAEPLTNHPNDTIQSRMSPTETCARTPNIYRATHWVYDPATGYCAWCGERIN